MTDTSEADVRAVREVVEQASAAQNDPGRLLALHTQDTAIVNVVGRRVLGLEALDRAMDAALPSPLADVRTSVTMLDVRFPGVDVAVVSCTKFVHDERSDEARGDDGSSDFPTTGALTYVLVRRGEGWRTALTQTTPAFV